MARADLTRLHLEATQLGAELITTQKDWARLPPEWRDGVLVLDVYLIFWTGVMLKSFISI